MWVLWSGSSHIPSLSNLIWLLIPMVDFASPVLLAKLCLCINSHYEVQFCHANFKFKKMKLANNLRAAYIFGNSLF